VRPAALFGVRQHAAALQRGNSEEIPQQSARGSAGGFMEPSVIHRRPAGTISFRQGIPLSRWRRLFVLGLAACFCASSARASAGWGPLLPLVIERLYRPSRVLGAMLLKRAEQGVITLPHLERDTEYLRQLSRSGVVLSPQKRPVPIALPLLRTLDLLSSRSSREMPLELLSLYRPLKPARPREPHGNGMAADISAFAGCRIDSRQIERCVKGVIAFIDALPPGEYRIGLPKPPNTDPVPYLPPPPRPKRWPFFPAPLPRTVTLFGAIFVLARPELAQPRAGDSKGAAARAVAPRPAVSKPWVERWENERGAPLSDIGDARVRAAIRAAVRRGANIYSLFPDALDHLHYDVRPLSGSGSALDAGSRPARRRNPRSGRRGS
jgi:hypothetical protein